jgi:peptidoglycan/xylan/chitin deacetylase (PgdA/CDA1 family)
MLFSAMFICIAGAAAVFSLTYVPGVLLRAWQVGRLRRACRGKLVLTYDDGPGPVSPTPQILEVLRRHGARATFFLLGARAVEAEAMCYRLVAEGHEIGAHSFHHLHAWKNPVRAVRDLGRGIHAVARWRQGRPVYRQPYGKSTLWTVLAAAGFGARPAWWTVDSGDTWPNVPDREAVVRRVEREQGGVVLMHDLPREANSERVQFTLDLTEQLLALAGRHGWPVCTFSELPGSAARRGAEQRDPDLETNPLSCGPRS